MLEGMISNRLGGTVFREKLKRSGPDFLSIVKAIVCGSCFGIVHVGSIFIGHGFRKLLINQTGIGRFSCGLASHAYFRPLIKWVRCFGKIIRLQNFGLIVSFPMLYASLQGIEVFSIGFKSTFLGLKLIVGFGRWLSLEVEAAAGSFLYMFGMIVLGLCVLEVLIFVDGVVMVVIIECVDFVCFSFGGCPYLIIFL